MYKIQPIVIQSIMKTSLETKIYKTLLFISFILLIASLFLYFIAPSILVQVVSILSCICIVITAFALQGSKEMKEQKVAKKYTLITLTPSLYYIVEGFIYGVFSGIFLLDIIIPEKIPTLLFPCSLLLLPLAQSIKKRPTS